MKFIFVSLLLMSSSLYALNLTSDNDGNVIIKNGLVEKHTTIYVIDSASGEKIELNQAANVKITESGNDLKLNDTGNKARDLLIIKDDGNNIQRFRINFSQAGNTAGISRPVTLSSSSDDDNVPFIFSAQPSGSGEENTEIINKTFTTQDLRQKSFKDNILINTVFDNNQLQQSDFSQSGITNGRFNKSDLTQADFSQAELVNVDFSQSTLNQANFKDAQLINVSFEGSDLSGAIWTTGEVCQPLSQGYCKR